MPKLGKKSSSSPTHSHDGMDSLPPPPVKSVPLRKGDDRSCLPSTPSGSTPKVQESRTRSSSSRSVDAGRSADPLPSTSSGTPDICKVMFDPGPKHSTPVKEYENRTDRSGIVSLVHSTHSDVMKGSAAQTLTSCATASFETVVKEPLQRHGAHNSGSSNVQHWSSGTVPLPGSMAFQLCGKDEQSVVAQQRQEIEVLVAELRERDHELNELVTSHQHQMSVWEQDRQLILRLQHKCHRLEVDLQQLKEKAGQRELEKSREKSQQAPGHHHMCSDNIKSMHFQQLQNCNENLNDSLKELCTAKGQLEARMEELTTLLKLKEQSLSDAYQEIENLRANVKFAEMQKEDHCSATKQLTDYWQQHSKTVKEENDKLLGACQEKDRQLQQATSQLQDMLQQALVLQQALCVNCEREKNKDELINSLRARQERCYLELNQLRNLYRRQNREMTLLQLTLDTSKESGQEPTDHEEVANTDPILNISHDTNVTDSCIIPVKTSDGIHTVKPGDALVCSSDLGKLYSRKGSEIDESECCADKNTELTECYHTFKACTSSREDSTDRWKSDCNSRANLNHSNNTVTVRRQEREEEQHHSPMLPISPRFPSTFISTGHSLPDRNPSSNSMQPSAGGLEDSTRAGLVQREQDVDTEAFWQKIISVRHGNQNTSATVKDLIQLPQKHLKETEMEMKPVSLNQHPADRSTRAVSRKKSVELNMLSRGSFKDDSAVETVRSKADITHASKIADHLPSSSDQSQHFLRNNHCLKEDRRNFVTPGSCYRSGEQSEKTLIQCQPQFWLCGQSNRHVNSTISSSDFPLTGNSTSHPHSDVLTEQEVQSNAANLKKDKQPELKQCPNSIINREMMTSASVEFEEKLSSFLETPEADSSVELLKSQDTSSPASKLHRLLRESQEMIKALDGTVFPEKQ